MGTMLDQYGEIIVAVLTFLTALMGVLSGWLIWQQHKQRGLNKERDKELEQVKADAERDRQDFQREMQQIRSNAQVQERFFEVIVADRQEAAERDRRHTASYDLLRQAIEQSTTVDLDVKDSLSQFRAEMTTLRDETQESRQKFKDAEAEYRTLRDKINEYIRFVEKAFKEIQDEIGSALHARSDESKGISDVLDELHEIRKVIESSMASIKEQRERTKPIPVLSDSPDE